MCQIPIDFLQDAMGDEGLEIMVFFARMLYRAAQDEIARQVDELKKEYDVNPPCITQEETASGGPGP